MPLNRLFKFKYQKVRNTLKSVRYSKIWCKSLFDVCPSVPSQGCSSTYTNWWWVHDGHLIFSFCMVYRSLIIHLHNYLQTWFQLWTYQIFRILLVFWLARPFLMGIQLLFAHFLRWDAVKRSMQWRENHSHLQSASAAICVFSRVFCFVWYCEKICFLQVGKCFFAHLN